MLEETKPKYLALRGARRQNLRDIVPLPMPFTIYIEPTNVCNFKCTYCPVHFDDYAERSGGLSKLSVESCGKILDEILSLGQLRTLNFYMLGEPYANRDLPKFIAMARRREVADRIIVTTNATLLNEEMARQTIDAGLDYLRVSVYGATQDDHEAVTGSKIPLDRVIENVGRLKGMRDAAGAMTPHVYVKMIDTGDAAKNALFRELFAPICDEVAIEPAMNWNLAEEVIDLSGFGERLKDTAYFDRRKTACPFPFYTLVVNADLRVTVCCVDWEKATVVGNLGTQSLKEIWSGEALRDFRLAHLRGERHTIEACRSCTFLHTAPDRIDDLGADEFLARTTPCR